MAELSKLNLPNVHFLIAGVGPYCEKLKELAINRNLSNVQFIPLQPHDVFIQILKAATLHLVIQRRSASDLVMPSKLATILGIGGLALVTADAGSSLFELITTNNIALIVEPENFKDLYEMIEKVTKLNQMDSDNFSHINHYGNFNYANIEKIKENAANYAEKHLSREVVIDGFLKNIS